MTKENKRCVLCNNVQELNNVVMGQPVCSDHSYLSPEMAEIMAHKIYEDSQLKNNRIIYDK